MVSSAPPIDFQPSGASHGRRNPSGSTLFHRLLRRNERRVAEHHHEVWDSLLTKNNLDLYSLVGVEFTEHILFH